MRFKVLLIDDEPAALEGLQLWINWEELGFEVCGTCANGEEGLKLIAELNPDLVVTDVKMPLMDGLEMIEEWQRSGSREVKFAIVSGYNEFEYARKALRYGITYYLLKPVEEEEAETALRAIYLELVHEAKRQQKSETALREEQISIIRRLLEYAHENEWECPGEMTALFANQDAWNICLVQTGTSVFTELRGIAASLISKNRAMFLIDLEKNLFGIVFGYTAGDGFKGHSFQRLFELSSLYAGQKVFMATGSPTRTFMRLADCYRTAKIALKFKFYDPEYTGVISYDSVPNRNFQTRYSAVRLVDNVMRLLNLRNAEEYEQTILEEATRIRDKLFDPEKVKNTFIHILFKMKEYVAEAGGGQAATFISDDLPDLGESLMNLNDYTALLLHYGLSCIKWLSGEQEYKSLGIVREINEYIRENYCERLTIKQLAERFYLHPVYLGQLLMMKNGVGFNEQLHNYRIEEASRLLRQRHFTNSEIAEKVGYNNYNQFLKQFEKRMGISPNEYKNRNQKF